MAQGYYDANWKWHDGSASRGRLNKAEASDSDDDEESTSYNTSGYINMSPSPALFSAMQPENNVTYHVHKYSTCVDSGANRDVSPYLADFTSLRKIPTARRRAISGWEGSSSTPAYIGTIRVPVKSRTQRQHHWNRSNVFYHPPATARIVAHSRIKSSETMSICLNELVMQSSGIDIPIMEANGLYFVDTTAGTNGMTLEQLLAAPSETQIPDDNTKMTCNAMSPSSNDFQKLHHTFGHLSEVTLRKTSSHSSSELSIPSKQHLGFCEDCPFGTIKKFPHAATRTLEKQPHGHKFHFDMQGPYTIPQIPGKIIMGQLIIEDGTHKMWFMGAVQKKLMLTATKVWYAELMASDEMKGKPKVFRFDSDPSTYAAPEWTDWVRSQHIRRELVVPGAHEAHGLAERNIGVSRGMAFSMLHYNQRGKEFFFMAMMYATDVRDVTYTTSTNSIPMADWLHAVVTEAMYARYHIHGCDCYARIDPDNLTKLDFKADKGIFVGIDHNSSTGYMIWFPTTKQLLVRKDVLFDELWIEDARPVPKPVQLTPQKIPDVISTSTPTMTDTQAREVKSTAQADMYDSASDDDSDEDVPTMRTTATYPVRATIPVSMHPKLF